MLNQEKMLGKIKSVKLGTGGYDDAMFGIDFTLGGDGFGVCDFWGTWESYSKGSKYSETDWLKSHAENYHRLMKLMKEAKVKNFTQLEGKPIEIVFNNGTLVSWRILSEVL